MAGGSLITSTKTISPAVKRLERISGADLRRASGPARDREQAAASRGYFGQTGIDRLKRNG